jgi:succinate dehydrogenase hydrophobic anchor subunit
MLIKILVLLLFIAIIFSLFSGLYFLLKDQSRSQRTVKSLALRVTLAIALLLLVIYGFYSGDLALRTPFPISTS